MHRINRNLLLSLSIFAFIGCAVESEDLSSSGDLDDSSKRETVYLTDGGSDHHPFTPSIGGSGVPEPVAFFHHISIEADGGVAVGFYAPNQEEAQMTVNAGEALVLTGRMCGIEAGESRIAPLTLRLDSGASAIAHVQSNMFHCDAATRRSIFAAALTCETAAETLGDGTDDAYDETSCDGAPSLRVQMDRVDEFGDPIESKTVILDRKPERR